MLTDSTRLLFSDRNFRLYTLASLTSWLSFFVQTLAVSWLAWELTHSPAWLGIIAFLDAAPYFLFGPWGSVLSDRMDRFRLLYVTYVFALLQAVLLALASAGGMLDIHMLGVLAFVHGTIHAFSVPAAYGLLPRAVNKGNLPAAIAFSSAYRTLAMFAGPALAGLLLAVSPVYVSFAINAAGYGVYLVALRRMRLPPAEPAQPSGKGFYGDYLDGLRYSLRHPLIGLLLLLTFFNDGLRALTMRLLPAFADRVFGVGAEGLATLAAVTGIGAAIGSVWLSQGRSTARLGRVALVGFAVGIASTAAFVASTQPWMAIAARAVFGLSAEAALTATVILLQSHVSEQYRSRVMGLAFLAAQASNLAMVVIGPLTARFGLDGPLYVYLALASGVLWWIWRRVARDGWGRGVA